MILVSGGSGLVGSYLIRSLVEKGKKVRAIYRNEQSLKKAQFVLNAICSYSTYNQVEWFQADLLDLSTLEEAFNEIQDVYHCAAMVSFEPKNRNRMMDVNVEGTANLINLSLKSQIRKFCFVSSVAALGKYRDGQPSDEKTLWQKEKNTSDYAISKFFGENEVWRGAEEGLDVVIVNPSVIIGFGDWNNSSNSLFKKVNDGMPVYPPGSTGFVAVEDVVHSMIQLMESDYKQERYLISSENVPYQSVFNWIATSLNKKPPTILLKKWQAYIYMYLSSFLAFFSGKTSPIGRSSINSAFSKRKFNHQKIVNAIGIEFMPIEEAIKKSGLLYKENYLD